MRLGVSTARLWAAVLLFALSPLALGPISLNTYDAWPALLTLAALALLLAGRDVAAFALLGAAFAAKVYPVVLVPPAVIFVWRTSGRGLALRALAAFAAVAALFVMPFLVLAPHGLAESFRAQAARSLQVESLGGSLLAVADRLGLYSATVVHRTGHAISYDLVGSLPETLAVVSSIAQALAVLAVAWLYLRGRDDPRRLALAFTRRNRRLSRVHPLLLAAVSGLARAVRAPARACRWFLVAAALVLAQVWFFHYSDVFALGGYVWLVPIRDLLILALFLLALLRLRRLAPEDEDPVLLEHELPFRVSS